MKKELVGFDGNEHTAAYSADIESNGACNKYVIENYHSGETLATLKFQDGPTKEVPVNGIFNEDLILIVKDRLESFQTGKYNCVENDLAIQAANVLLKALHMRKQGRTLRGVYGTHTP